MQSYSTCLFSLISSACNQPGMKEHKNQTSFPIPPPGFASWMTLGGSYDPEGPLLAHSPQPPRRWQVPQGLRRLSGREWALHKSSFNSI